MGTLVSFSTWQPSEQPTITPSTVRALRDEMEISQETLARLINVSTSCIRKWESGERVPTGRWLNRLLLLLAERRHVRELKQA